ncbi:hemagglutinin [Influenza A virus (A/black-headed gull/Netherlands/37/2008(H13N8))]|uniref:Hemagglutinin n=14 Tax=Influenza A virus TaxID=11320 RepID=A0A1Z1X0U5_9INFA|nr:hemagglutinin [Influenza A virus (A/black-headed gull/Netherlands/9/2008(H13N8))]ARX91704.1 hemagglutinin [Influenza A virus (A/black-headed gull/Netherlands/14/2008(H13N8))]ARX91905.1 hemagglutinin [Influenza A virus (A/black-headed gull/Netherlands/5/2008(H13N8))]ARX92044.1 hemagglutinin [Influenza A virus (A/black-headed gull/Netherlands/12/2008(H13N8))]ARX92186.1 hemagglutinin [Influenza A virus (A/black-headed gull/Netherlands/30/2008(H13N8))]ARX92269.1 hemagglutinin [Influenza A virus
MEVPVFVLLMLTSICVQADRICVGYLSTNSSERVDTLLENNVPVTSSVDLVETNHTGTYCSLGGISPVHLGDCSFEGWIVGNPACASNLGIREWSYLIEDPSAPHGLCYPGELDNNGELRHLFSGIRSFSRTELIAPTSWGEVNDGVTAACQDRGASSFYRNLVWFVARENKYPVIRGTYNNTTGRDVLVIWGIHHPVSTDEARKLYAKDNPYTLASTSSWSRKYNLETGTRPGYNGQKSWMKMYWYLMHPGDSINFESNGGLLAPRYGYIIEEYGKGRIFQSRIRIAKCNTKCQTSVGGINTNKTFQNIERNALGDCPKYIKSGQLKLATGLRNVPAISNRGLFGAIAGFIEGGWPGLINGWYGFQHQNEQGTGMAADKESTQKAIDQITTKINNIIEKMNGNYDSIRGEFSQVEQRINMLADRIDDAVTDVWSYNAKLLVLLENDKTLDMHDANVRNLHDQVRRVLRTNAIDEGNGCFELLHKCNDSCMETIRNGTYNHIEYEEESKLKRQEIEGIKLKSDDNVYKTLSIYSCIASSIVLVGLILAFIMWACSSGNCRFNICI